MIETPDPSDPLTPARIAIRVLWCAAADTAVLFDAPRVRFGPGGAVRDELAAAAELASLSTPLVLTAAADGDVLELRTSAPAAEDRARSWVFEWIEVPDPDAASILAWTAGRGLRVSRRALAHANAAFRFVNAGFVAAYRKEDLVPHLARDLGVAADELVGVEWAFLAGRPRPPGSPPGGSAPLRRVSATGERA